MNRPQPLRRVVRRRCRPTLPALACAAVGWQLGTANLAAGTLTCPLCDRSVPARPVRAGVVEVEPHPPADAVTCPCGTTHARYACPTCGCQLTVAEAVLARLAVTSGEAR
jgi:hypothetical protein